MPHSNDNPNELLKLREYHTDMFLDLLLNDFAKISNTIQAKAKQETALREQQKRYKRENPMTPPPPSPPKNKYAIDKPVKVEDDTVALSFDEFMAIDFGFKEGERF